MRVLDIGNIAMLLPSMRSQGSLPRGIAVWPTIPNASERCLCFSKAAR
jgi:hypothetical protein